MKVVLLQDIENIGKKFEVKEVANGHAKNLLIPKKLAQPATKKAVEWAEMQRDIQNKREEDDLKSIQELASRLDDLEVTIPVKVGDEGQLYESITSQNISDQIQAMGFDVQKRQVHIQEPLKELGEFPVKIVLDHNLEAEVRVVIVEQ
jgi:large subunit ribosomal protein L9